MFPDTKKHILDKTLAACDHAINVAVSCKLDGQQGTNQGMMVIPLLEFEIFYTSIISYHCDAL